MLTDYLPQINNYLPNAFLRAAVILLVVFAVIWLIMFIIRRVFVQLTKKTETDLDDRIIENSSKPITMIALFVGLRVAFLELPIPAGLMDVFVNIINSLLIVTVSWLAFVVLDILLVAGWMKVTKKTKSTVDDSLFNLVHGLMKAIWVVFTFLYVLNLWGVEIGPFLAGLGIGGLAIAFALQESLANIFGGVSIILDKTIKVGDLVYLDDGTQGKILHIGLRGTRIRTFDDDAVVVPNGKLANSVIKNVALLGVKTRVVIPFGVAYGSDIDKVKKLIIGEMKKLKYLKKGEVPVVRFLEMADSSLNFKAYAFIDSFDNKAASVDEANTRIYNALNKAGIEIPYPHLDVSVKK